MEILTEYETEKKILLNDINDYSNWKKVEKISKGWSSDIKYLVTTNDDHKLLLRISDIECYEE